MSALGWLAPDDDFCAAGAVMRRFLRRLGAGGLSAVALLGLADRVDGMYLNSGVYEGSAYVEGKRADHALGREGWYFGWGTGDYLDRVWYYFLDDGQYYYLDREQYNLMGGLSYLLGHPSYPKLFERDLDQSVGFTNRKVGNWLPMLKATVRSRQGRLAPRPVDCPCGYGHVTLTAWANELPILPAAILYSHFNAGDYIDRARYYYLDKGQYFYLDKGQYSLLGGSGYLFGHPYGWRPYAWDFHGIEKSGGCPVPEPSTIGLLALGAFALLSSRTKSDCC